MNLPFNLRDELEKLRKLELAALKADNAVLRQRLKIFPPVEQECAKALGLMDRMKDRLIVEAVNANGTMATAAKELGIGRSTLYKRLRKINGALGLLLFSISLFAAPTNTFYPPGTVTLRWDPPPPCNGCTTNLSYRLYAHTNAITKTNLASALVRLDAGTNLTAVLTDLSQGLWRFAATSYTTNGTESVPSDNVTAEVPAAPQNMRTVILQWSATVIGTNWLDAGFFRVKFGE
jgi:hypothetical protein